jgi:ribosomal protein L11 methyltransferase
MSSCTPYEDLYIYLVEGQVMEKDEIGLGKEFLGNWVEDSNSFLFFSKPVRARIEVLLRDRADLVLIDEYRFAYDQWQGSVSEPIRVDPFLIIPPWVDIEPNPEEILIKVDPGVVFGTGIHPTTKDCLRAIISLQEGHRVKVLDLGTGTGILALAAGFLGAGEVTAIDLNPLAVKTTKRNVLLNHLEGIISVVQGQAQDFVDQPADLVIANIHHGVVEELLEKEGFRQKPRVIISGLMRSQVRDVKVQTQRYGLEVVREWDHEMTWYTLLLARS